MRNPFFALLPVACLIALPANAQDGTQSEPQTQETVQIDMALIEQAYRAGDFVLARKGLEVLAQDETNALAHYRYGRVLLQGLGGPADRETAILWLQKAVARNNPDAATLLGRVYLAQGEFYNAEEAAKLFANAAARGDEEAQYYLGRLYQEGRGVAQDDTAAFSWFLAASEAEQTEAKYELSKAYSRGLGTVENVEQALRWLRSAAEDGHPEAQYFLAYNLENGPKKQRAPGEALDWYRRAAENNSAIAQRTLGTRYLQGLSGVKPNAEEALRWLNAAAEADDPGAMQNLAIGYASGEVLPQDDQLAAYWFERGSSLGLGRASLSLGALYQAGRGVPQNLQKAVDLYQLAASQGEKNAALRLGNMAIDGSLNGAMAPHDVAPFVALILREAEDSTAAQAWLQTQADAGVRPAQEILGVWFIDEGEDIAAGVALLEAAATGGSVPAQGRLGALYSTGDGVELDYVTAHKWLNIAAASGDSEAAETRNLINDLMTPEQIAEAQTAARQFFDTASARVPQTVQVVRESGGTEQAPKDSE